MKKTTYSIQSVYDKGSHEVNEDEILVKGNLYAVFDGSGLSKFQEEKGQTGGKLAALKAKQALSKNRGSLKQMAIEANEKIGEMLEKQRKKTNSPEGYCATAAAAVRLSENKIEVMNIADSLVLAIYQDGNYNLLTPFIDHDNHAMNTLKAKIVSGAINITEAMEKEKQMIRQNANKTYGSLNGTKEAEKFIYSRTYSLEKIKSIILFTDGLLIPKEDPNSAEDWKSFVEIYKKYGLKGLAEHVRKIEETDPLCTKYPRWKKHDDITGIGIDFEEYK